MSREIRQKILYYTFDHAHHADLDANFECRNDDDWVFVPCEMEEWAGLLGSLHPTLEADLPYVLEQRKMELVAEFPIYAEERQDIEEEQLEEQFYLHDRGRCEPYDCEFCSDEHTTEWDLSNGPWQRRRELDEDEECDSDCSLCSHAGTGDGEEENYESEDATVVDEEDWNQYKVQPAPPLGYLSLPIEIRQNILFGSFDDAHNKDLNSNYKRTWRERPIRPYNMRRWAANLSAVHPTVEEDLDWVLRQRQTKFLSALYPYIQERYETLNEEGRVHERFCPLREDEEKGLSLDYRKCSYCLREMMASFDCDCTSGNDTEEENDYSEEDFWAGPTETKTRLESSARRAAARQGFVKRLTEDQEKSTAKKQRLL